MHQYKKFACILLLFVFAFSMAGCEQSQSSTADAGKDKKIEETAKEKENKKEAEPETKTETGAEQPDAAKEQASADSNVTQEPDDQQKTAAQPASGNQPAASAQPAPAPPSKPQAAVHTPQPQPADTVTISIIGPKDRGTILGATKVEIKEGDTVFSVLMKAGKKVEYSGSGSTVYVEGIDNIYEGDYGGTSGWTYKLNGTMTPKSAGAVKVKDGDQIVWEYVGG
jgi:cytoskeletal protein RodZ